MLDQHLDRVKDRELAAGGKHRFIRRIARAEIRRMPLDDRLAHIRNPRNRGISREVSLDSRNRRILDVLRRGEMRLPRAKVHQVHALRAQPRSLSGHGHGGGNFNPVNAVGKQLAGSGRGSRGCAHAFSFSDFSRSV